MKQFNNFQKTAISNFTTILRFQRKIYPIFLLIITTSSYLNTLNAQKIQSISDKQALFITNERDGIKYDFFDGSPEIDSCSAKGLWGFNFDTSFQTPAISRFNQGYYLDDVLSNLVPNTPNSSKFVNILHYSNPTSSSLSIIDVNHQSGLFSTITYPQTTTKIPKFLSPNISNSANNDWLLSGSFYFGDFYFENPSLYTLNNSSHTYHHGFAVLFNDTHQVKWAKSITGHTSLTTSKVAPNGNVYLLGARHPKYGSLLDNHLIAGDNNIPSTELNGFIGKVDTNGNVLSFNNLFLQNVSYIRLVDIHFSEDAYYLVGSVKGNAQFDNNTSVNRGHISGFVAKYNLETDTLIWEKHSIQNSQYFIEKSIMDSLGHIYIMGHTTGGAWTFGDTSTVYTENDFILKLDTVGNTVCKYSIPSSSSYNHFLDISTNNEGDIYALSFQEANPIFENSIFYITNLGNNCQYEIRDSILIAPCYVSTQEEKNTVDVKVFPNPASDFIQIEMTERGSIETAFCSIYNVNGQLLLEKKLTSFQEKINIQHLLNGIYFLQIQTEEGVLSKKFIKY